ncbi:MAG TPA: DUF222 domain-containing protein [Candidatus Sulfotelmatobacter sp.]|nr:DUF222 domain-containing protein [Candidatus Sulfotelmatobacter sp.]
MVELDDPSVDLELPGAEESIKMVGLRWFIDRLEVEFSEMAASFKQSKYWDYEGFNTAGDWMRFNCHMTSTAAADRINVGGHLHEIKGTTAAMDAGEVGFAHVTVMARTADAVGKAFDESQLLPLAKENSPGKFHYKCMHYRHSIDAQAYADTQAREAESRRLRLSTAEDGSLLISGALDPIGGAVVRSALEPLARPSGAYDHRDQEQRYADALVELASNGGHQKVQLQVTTSLETLKGLAGAPAAEMEFSLPLSSKTVERLACDCSVTRVLLNQKSVVIDVGQAERTIKGPKRRALNARDQHCQWPGCERPASWCDGHHFVHWIHGGGSELGNLTLLCARHHWKVHEGGWQLVKTEEGRILPVAPTPTFGLPRGPD